MSWFEWYPGRLDKELQALRDAKIAFELDEQQLGEGIVRLLLRYGYGGEEFELVALYPEFFPYFPPEVFAPNRAFRRHQDPNSRNLCLLGRRSDRWCSDWTLAEVLSTSLKIIIDFDRTGDEHVIKALEEPQGEPITDYLNGKGIEGSLAIYDSEMEIPPEVNFGWLEASFDSMAPPRLAVRRILDDKKAVIASWTAYPAQSAATRQIPWLKANGRLLGSFDEIREIYASEAGRRLQPKHSSPSSRHLFAILIQEEVEQFAFQYGWMVFETTKKSGGAIRSVKTFRAGARDLRARMPSVALESKSIAVVGLGVIGSTVALELARNGIKSLHVIDFDFVEPATVRRWASGRPSFGLPKVQAFAELVGREYPTTIVSQCTMKIGAYRDAPQNDYERLISILRDVDVVVDTSIEVGVNGLLSRICWEMEKPYVIASASPGAWGGRVCQFARDRGHACWVCYQNDLDERGAVYQPPFDPAGEVQPPGCAARTFTGTSFDLAEISMEAVRVACSLVPNSSYPNADWQIGICAMRNADGSRILPSWQSIAVERREACECRVD